MDLKWATRLKDEVPGVITAERLAELYAARDIETLKHSVVTNMSFFLKRIVKDNIIHTIHTSVNDKIVFEINVWPYKDIDDGFVDMLIECVRFHTYSTASVVVVDIPPEAMSPDFMASRYKVAIFYTEWIEWVSAHKEFFEKRGVPELTVVLPMLFDKSANYDEMKAMGKRPSAIFHEMKMTLAPMFAAVFHDSSLYSISEQLTQEYAAAAVDMVSITAEDIEQHILKKDPNAVITEVPINREIPLDLHSDPSESKEKDPEYDPFSFDAD